MTRIAVQRLFLNEAGEVVFEDDASARTLLVPAGDVIPDGYAPPGETWDPSVAAEIPVATAKIFADADGRHVSEDDPSARVLVAAVGDVIPLEVIQQSVVLRTNGSGPCSGGLQLGAPNGRRLPSQRVPVSRPREGTDLTLVSL